MQDHYADLVNLSQSLSVGSIAVGEAGLLISRYGAGILRIAGQLRVDSAINGVTGFQVNGVPLAASHLSDSAQVARLANPAFTGTPTAPTPGVGDSSTKIATTAFVASALAAVYSPIPPTKTILTSGSGTYNIPLNCRAIFVECVGGGATGGQAQTGSNATYAVGSGGNGGWYACKVITTPLASYSYVVGAGAAAIAGGGTWTSNPGSDSTFGGSTVIAKGGAAGTKDGQAGHSSPWMTSPPAHQSGSVGDIVIPGGYGGPGKIITPGGWAEAGAGGHGGGPYGGPGAPMVASGSGASTAGNAATAGYYGAASSGSIAGQFSAGALGVGAGAGGIIVITEYY